MSRLTTGLGFQGNDCADSVPVRPGAFQVYCKPVPLVSHIVAIERRCHRRTSALDISRVVASDKIEISVVVNVDRGDTPGVLSVIASERHGNVGEGRDAVSIQTIVPEKDVCFVPIPGAAVPELLREEIARLVFLYLRDRASNVGQS